MMENDRDFHKDHTKKGATRDSLLFSNTLIKTIVGMVWSGQEKNVREKVQELEREAKRDVTLGIQVNPFLSVGGYSG